VKPDDKRLAQMRHERSLVIIKPDGVARHLVGEILARFERKGLKIAALKLVWPTAELAGKHYVDSEEWVMDSGQRSYDSYVSRGLEPPMGPRELALNTRRKLIEALTSGPVVVMVLEGAHAIPAVRAMRGATSPMTAVPGTIGFDYSLESYELSDAGDWAIKNIIHGSDSPENAAREINIWFKPDELVNYETAITEVAYTKDWRPHYRRVV
jgi:nucleoside-diphosphate kinase